jgi:adenylate cyclase
MSDIFISYARSTEAQAHLIAELLRAAGFDVWRDDALPAHLPYADVIETQLRVAKAVVVVWSADAAKSQWVRAEADLARSAGTLVQLTVDHAPLPLPFNQIQCAQLTNWNGAVDAPGWLKVLASVEALVHGAAAPNRADPPDRRASHGAKPAAASSGKAVVIVPPFADLSPADTQDFLAEGLREDILAALSRHASLTVRPDAEAGFGGTARSYLLDAQVRRAGTRVRISARLTNAAGGEAIWSERYDDTSDDLFELQDRIALNAAANIEAAIRREQIRGAPDITGGGASDGASADDLYLNGVRLINLAEKPGYFEALDLLGRAVALQPDHAQAWAAMALAHANIWMNGYPETTDDNRAGGIACAQKALALTDSDSFATGLAAVSLAYLGESVAVSSGLIDRILTLNPSYAVAWVWSGTIRLIAGDLDTAIAHLDTALRLDMRTSIRPLILTFAGAAHLLAGRHDAAATALNEAHRLRPQLPFAPLFLAASLGQAGEVAAARDMLARCDALERPDRYRFPLHGPGHQDALAAALRRAAGGA